MSVGTTELGLDRVNVAFMIDIDQVAWRIPLRRTNVERPKNFEGPSIQDVDVRGPRDIQKPLLRIGGECYRSCLQRELAVDADKLLRNEFSLGREYLDPLIPPIGHVREPVVRKLYIVRQ